MVIYPGSFDPITNGHIGIVKRGLRIFPHILMAVAHNPRKSCLFKPEERVEMIREVLADEPRVDVESFEGLLVEYCRRKGAHAIIRGLRAVSDFEYEFQMGTMNHKLAPEIETFFMMTGEGHFYISSQTVKEVASLNGCVNEFVPSLVARRLREKFSEGEAKTRGGRK
ncbi:MAG: pantetheine-phosphate adenylyltransferase [Deltaproteobacteria bacterium]|nr:pantetheine-phosphate adenylyltransferase [Deltaproteobacteria bacterium]